MNSFTTFSRVLFVMTAILMIIIHPAVPYDCSPPSVNIRCECTTKTTECSGTQVDILEIEDVITNISRIENVILKINDLQFKSDIILENSGIKNLTIGYTKHGSRLLTSNFFSGANSSLISLNLQNNSIEKIDDYFFSDLSLLTELFLDNNEIENLTTNTFVNLNNLKHLSISYNNIRDVSPEVFENLMSLETLILSHNKFSLIENINIKSATLIELKIDNCLIEGLIQKNTLMEVPNTEKLDISYNQLSGIESHSLSSLKNLKYLNLSYNVIEYLEENAFSDISNLTTLDLQGNKISVIKISSFEKLRNLKYFDLSSNKLKAVLCEYTTDFTSLERIFLQNNEIKAFTAGAFFYSPKLKEMDLTGNNLECSCPLTESARYLIENGTMERTALESISCIIPSTGSLLPITKYESSKCIPVEPCKKIETVDEEYEDYYEDLTSSSTTNTASSTFLSTKNVSLEKSTTMIPTTESDFNETETESSMLKTPIYNTSNTMTVSTSSEDTKVPFTETTTIFFTVDSISDNNSEKSSTTFSVSSEITTANIFATVTTENSIVDNSSEKPNTTFSASSEVTTANVFVTTTTENSIPDNSSEKLNTTFLISSEMTTANAFTTPISERFLATSTTVTSKVISPESESDCTSLQLSISNLSLSSNLTIFKNFSNKNNNFCLKWTVVGIEGLKIRCSIKYTTTAGTKVLNLQCPSYAYEIKEWSKNEKIFKFCIIIYPEGKKKQDSCELLFFEKNTTTFSTTTTTKTSTALTENSTDESFMLFDKATTDISSTTRNNTTTTLTTITTKTSTALSANSTDESFTLFDKTTTDASTRSSSEISTVFDKNTTFLTSDKINPDTSSGKITAVTSENYPTDFSITALNLYFNDSKLAFTTWAVNKWQPLHECNLTLKVSTQYFEEIEGVFPCKNNTYRLTRVKEDDIFKVCLISYHMISGKNNLCQHTLPSATAKASISKDDSLNISIIPLICLLIFVGLIILFIVIKNISKRRSVSKKYDVRAEEEKYQERVKLRPQSLHEESVRFSYIAKENHEYI